MALKTDYKDDILATGNLRKYQMIQNNDGTVSFQDVTQYAQTGDIFGAGDINKTNQAVNEKFDSDDVVDPKLATEEGFAADAKLTGDALSELNKNLRDIIIIKNRNYNITPTTEKSVIEFEYDLTDLIPSGYKSIFLMSYINYTDGHDYQQAIISDVNSHTNPKGIGRIYCEENIVGVNVCVSLICLKNFIKKSI